MKFKLPFTRGNGPERSPAAGFQPPVTSPEEESRKSTIMFLVGNERMWPTREDVRLELDRLPMFQNLTTGDLEQFADDVMARRSARKEMRSTNF